MKVRDSCIDYLSQFLKQIVCNSVNFNGISLQFDRIGEIIITTPSNVFITLLYNTTYRIAAIS